jgi:4-diphosphocytidyl-2-C-methyl-D-erythritol kinase
LKLACEFAPAKINLSLQVGALAANGYHPLSSLVVFANIGDRVSFVASSALSFALEGPFGGALEAGEDNLVMRAARALQAHNTSNKGAGITLRKALPVASGIGGGSADAAATLRGLNRLWGCGLSDPQLEHMARKLGADVPVCVQSRPRLMRGIGDVLEDVSGWPELDAVLVNPGFAVATKDVFARFDALGLGQAEDESGVRPAATKQAALKILERLSNALTPAACAEAPQIATLLDELVQYPQTRLARLCGSGATCVALVDSANAATQLAFDVQTAHPDYWVQAVKLGGSL